MAKYYLRYKHIKRETIEAVKDHWKLGFWKGDIVHRQKVFESLLKRLCEIYNIKSAPQIEIVKEDKNLGVFKPNLNLIVMNKYSLITFLHEFKHVKDVNEGKRVNEENARGWSLSIMYKVNPKYLIKIVQKGLVRFLTVEDLKEILCPLCYTPIRPDASYCYECGTAL